MAYNQEIGTADLRAEFVDSAVKGIAERLYKFKQAVDISTTNAWKNTYFRENPNVLTNAGNLSTKIPRGAQPPQGSVKWEEKSVYISKFMFEDVILWEDILTDEIDVKSRTLYGIAQKVTKDVDDEIWRVIAENPSATATFTNSEIQKVTIASGKHWSGSSAAIFDDLMNAKTLITQSNYDTSNCMVFLNPRDYRSIARWVVDKGTQFVPLANQVVTNGVVPGLAGFTFVESNSVTASYALVVVPKICATWREAVSFRTTTIEDPYISLKVRATEEGACLLTDPNAVCLICNTRGDDT